MCIILREKGMKANMNIHCGLGARNDFSRLCLPMEIQGTACFFRVIFLKLTNPKIRIHTSKVNMQV